MRETQEKSVRIIRHTTDRDFTILRNDALRDERLSWKSTGLLAYLISLPNDWRLFLADLSKRKRDGRDATRAGLAELERAGYLRIERVRDGGRYHETVWIVNDVPVQPDAEKPYSENPNTVNPNSEKPTLERTNSTKTHTQKNNPTKRAGPSAPGKRAFGPLSEGGVSRHTYTTDPQTKISLQVGNSADEDALAEIRQHHPDAIAQAVARAAAGEPSCRAYPTAVLRILRRAARPAPADADAPAWARRRAPAPAAPREIDITESGETL